MELEDIVEKLEKQKRTEKRLRRKAEKAEREQNKLERRKLMKFTSSQKWKLSDGEEKQLWRVFKSRRKSYYKFPRGVVYLASIPHGFYEEQMASYFSQFGKVTGIYMPRSPSGKSRGYAFIEFQLEVIAKIVAETMNNYLFYQRILKAKYIPPEKQKPYMFVFPFGDKRKKSIRIELERSRRVKSLTQNDVQNYKVKVQNKIEAMKKKMKSLGVEYDIQTSGSAPSVKVKKIIKQKSDESEGEPIQKKVTQKKKIRLEDLFDENLTKKIKLSIVKKLAKPLRQSMDSSSTIDDNDDDDDFETAEEDNYISLNEDDFSDMGSGVDDNFELNGDDNSSIDEFSDINSDIDDNFEKSPQKKTKSPKTLDQSLKRKLNTPKKSPEIGTPQSVGKGKEIETPQSGKKIKSSILQSESVKKKKNIATTPSIVEESCTPQKVGRKNKNETPESSKEKKNITPKPQSSKKKKNSGISPSIVEKEKSKNNTPLLVKTSEKVATPKNTPHLKFLEKHQSTIKELVETKITTPKVKKSIGKTETLDQSLKRKLNTPKKSPEIGTPQSVGKGKEIETPQSGKKNKSSILQSESVKKKKKNIATTPSIVEKSGTPQKVGRKNKNETPQSSKEKKNITPKPQSTKKKNNSGISPSIVEKEKSKNNTPLLVKTSEKVATPKNTPHLKFLEKHQSTIKELVETKITTPKVKKSIGKTEINKNKANLILKRKSLPNINEDLNKTKRTKIKTMQKKKKSLPL